MSFMRQAILLANPLICRTTEYRDSVCFQVFFYSAAQYCVKDYRIQISCRRLWRDGKTVSPVRIWNFHGRFKSMEFANLSYNNIGKKCIMQ